MDPVKATYLLYRSGVTTMKSALTKNIAREAIVERALRNELLTCREGNRNRKSSGLETYESIKILRARQLPLLAREGAVYHRACGPERHAGSYLTTTYQVTNHELVRITLPQGPAVREFR